MTLCTACFKEKNENDFAFRNKAKGTRRKQCKECVRDMDNKNYSNNQKRRDSIASRRNFNKSSNLAYVRNALSSGCIDCGNQDLRVLEFDHLDNFEKIDGVAVMARKGFSLEKIKKEILKCEIRCKNCHAIKTYERGGWTFAHGSLAEID